MLLFDVQLAQDCLAGPGPDFLGGVARHGDGDAITMNQRMVSALGEGAAVTAQKTLQFIGCHRSSVIRSDNLVKDSMGLAAVEFDMFGGLLHNQQWRCDS